MAIPKREPLTLSKSAQILEDRLKCVILAKVVSTTGKYFVFLGTHYNGKTLCHDVGSYNNVTGEIVRRHYQVKEEALAFWDTFRTDMTKPRQGGESEEPKGLKFYGPDGKLIN